RPEEAPRLVGDVLEVDQAAAFANDVEQVAMFARGRVGPFAGRAPGAFPALQPDEQGSAWRVADIAHQPITALATAVREVMSAHCLGLPGEAACKLRGISRHRILRDEKGPPSPAGQVGWFV